MIKIIRDNPLLLVIKKIIDTPSLNTSCMKIIKMLINYADDHNLIINVDEKTEKGDNPFSLAIISNGIDITEMLI